MCGVVVPNKRKYDIFDLPAKDEYVKISCSSRLSRLKIANISQNRAVFCIIIESDLLETLCVYYIIIVDLTEIFWFQNIWEWQLYGS